MKDAHVHIEQGPYSKGWIDVFVERAKMAGISELYLLEHSFRFNEFKGIYDCIGKHGEAGDYQRNWLESKCRLRLDQYKRLISALRDEQYPITVKFGLEICYFPEYEDAIREIVSDFAWDFLTGAIHWIDGFGFDHRENIPIWLKSDVNRLYRKYYALMVLAIESGIFDVIAHPDSIRCFNFYPSDDLGHLYKEVADCAKKQQVELEFSNGLFINYGHQELGMNRELLRVLQRVGVRLVTASDAHRPEDVGRHIREAEGIIRRGYA
jgi:histidinol-phosphatase (PHP family)